jgi:hypothetical protein
MASGFGAIDYVVVASIALCAAYLLSTRPALLLVLLPLFVTVDFFVPVATQLTPSRFVPMMLGAWLLLGSRRSMRTNEAIWLIPGATMLLLSLACALLEADSGLRPILRTLHYLNLYFLFLFTVRVSRDERALRSLLWGLVLAGAAHGGYAAYQLLAYNLGLPYRGIVYGASGAGGTALAAGEAFRINGLADEPKRLGYVLFAATLACLHFTPMLPVRRRVIVAAIALTCSTLSLLTFSVSYYLSVALALALIAATSPRAIRHLLFGALVLLAAASVFPQAIDRQSARMLAMLEARSAEVAAGLDSEVVYRQEFYANDFLRTHPEAAITGVGIGRYNRVLNDAYGTGVGYGPGGAVRPLNSQVLEIVLDLGAAGLVLFYGTLAAIILALGTRNAIEVALRSLLIFLAVQSLTIQDLQLTAIVMATSVACIRMRRRASVHPAPAFAGPPVQAAPRAERRPSA